MSEEADLGEHAQCEGKRQSPKRRLSDERGSWRCNVAAPHADRQWRRVTQEKKDQWAKHHGHRACQKDAGSAKAEHADQRGP